MQREEMSQRLATLAASVAVVVVVVVVVAMTTAVVEVVAAVVSDDAFGVIVNVLKRLLLRLLRWPLSLL